MKVQSCYVCLVLLGIIAFLPKTAFSDTGTDAPHARLIVTVCEYQLTNAPSATASSSEIASQLTNGDEKPVRVIRMPTLSDTVFDFREFDRIYLTEEPLMVGTNLQVTVSRSSNSVVMQFNYENSKLASENVAESTPRVTERSVQGNYSCQLGEPFLVGDLSADEKFCLVVTVTEPEEQAKD